MKRKSLKIAILAAACAAVLCSCGGNSDKATANELILAAKNCGAEFQEMEKVETSDIKYYYNLDESWYSDFAAVVSGNQAFADEIVVIKASSSSNVDNIKNALEERIQSRKTTLESYAPDEYQKLCNSSVKTKGDYVYLVVGDDINEAEKAIKDSF